jgi:hypothetical protein
MATAFWDVEMATMRVKCLQCTGATETACIRQPCTHTGRRGGLATYMHSHVSRVTRALVICAALAHACKRNGRASHSLMLSAQEHGHHDYHRMQSTCETHRKWVPPPAATHRCSCPGTKEDPLAQTC